MMATNTTRRRPQDLYNLILAACLFISPWILGFAGATTPARNAWIVAVALAVVTFVAMAAFAEWEEWMCLAFGLWLMAAPWALGFTGNVHAFWTHLGLGALTAAVSAWAVWDYRHEPHATA